MTDLLMDVSEFCAEWQDITQRINAEIDDLEPYIKGERESRYPLGSKFLLNRGHELQGLVSFIEQSLKKATPR